MYVLYLTWLYVIHIDVANCHLRLMINTANIMITKVYQRLCMPSLLLTGAQHHTHSPTKHSLRLICCEQQSHARNWLNNSVRKLLVDNIQSKTADAFIKLNCCQIKLLCRIYLSNVMVKSCHVTYIVYVCVYMYIHSPFDIGVKR